MSLRRNLRSRSTAPWSRPNRKNSGNSKLAAAHPKFNLNLINNGINEADIEEIREQMAFMMSSFSDLTAKDRQIQQLNAELTLTSGRLRQLESKLLPAGIGSELYTICPNATRVRWGRINEQGNNAQVPETFMAQLEVTLDAPFPRPEMEDSLAQCAESMAAGPA